MRDERACHCRRSSQGRSGCGHSSVHSLLRRRRCARCTLGGVAGQDRGLLKLDWSHRLPSRSGSGGGGDVLWPHHSYSCRPTRLAAVLLSSGSGGGQNGDVADWGGYVAAHWHRAVARCGGGLHCLQPLLLGLHCRFCTCYRCCGRVAVDDARGSCLLVMADCSWLALRDWRVVGIHRAECARTSCRAVSRTCTRRLCGRRCGGCHRCWRRCRRHRSACGGGSCGLLRSELRMSDMCDSTATGHRSRAGRRRPCRYLHCRGGRQRDGCVCRAQVVHAGSDGGSGLQLGGGESAGHEGGGAAAAMRVAVVDAAIGVGVAVAVVLGLRLGGAHRETEKSRTGGGVERWTVACSIDCRQPSARAELRNSTLSGTELDWMNRTAAPVADLTSELLSTAAELDGRRDDSSCGSGSSSTVAKLASGELDRSLCVMEATATKPNSVSFRLM